jgi:hypothetical protein
MDSSWKKPAAKMVKPKPMPVATSEEMVDAREAQEVLEAEQKRQAYIKESEDKIGALIGGSWFISNWTNPILAHPTLPQLSVSRFYPESFIAVDIFTYLGDWEKNLVAYKRKQFKELEIEYAGKKGHVRYGALSYADQLASLVPQLES